MPIEQNEIFDYGGGHICGTGLWVDDERPSSLPSLSSVLTQRLDQQDIREILDNPARLPARQRFPSRQWIRNQGSRGSCNGYACAWALARARVSLGQPFVGLSGEFVYAAINGGRDRGSRLEPGMKWLQENGAAPEDMVPHLEYLWNRVSAEAKAAARRFKAFECYAAPTERDLASGLALGFVGVVAVHFNGAMQRLDSNGVAGRSNGVGNHSVGVDDLRWRAGRFEFDYFNSHGLRYGDQGKAWLTWEDHFVQTTRYHQFFLIRASTDDTEDEFRIPAPMV
jgi:hypothetical protein